MSKREKILASLVGLLLALVVVKYVADRVTSAFQVRENQRVQLEREIKNKERAQLRGRIASRKIAEYEARSLPPHLDLANSQYRDWLLDLLDQAGLAERTVQGMDPRPRDDVYHQFNFKVTGRGTLEQIVKFLHSFYSIDHLHRVKTLALSPLNESNLLGLNLEIEALALTSVPKEQQKLVTKKSERLRGDVEEYVKDIVGRNIFAPGNSPPKFASSSLPPVHRGQPASLRLAATDPDQGQKLTFELQGEKPEGLKLNPETGEIQLTPEENGTIQLTVLVRDSGIPAKTAVQEFAIQVTDPPAQADVSPMQFAFLTAITETGGDRLAWFTLRTEGRVLKLLEGEQIQIGSLQGTIQRISARDVEILTADKRLIVSLGQPLSEAKELPLGE